MIKLKVFTNVMLVSDIDPEHTYDLDTPFFTCVGATEVVSVHTYGIEIC